MHARKLLPLGLVMALLLAAAGLASHGRPLSGSRGGGPTAHFFDYALTTVVLVAVGIVVVAVLPLLGSKLPKPGAPPRKWHILSTILMIASASLLSWFLVHAHLRIHMPAETQPKSQAHSTAATPGQVGHARGTRGAHLQWDEIAIVAVVVGGVFAYVMFSRGRRTPLPPWMLGSQSAVSAALDESLDDLRAEPDLRKAIIAAYARMERALAVSGIRRRPSEAPFEYLTRALRALDASADASRRLTALFEWAKFSQHAPEPAMRDEAIEALVAVRDELRHPTAVAA